MGDFFKDLIKSISLYTSPPQTLTTRQFPFTFNELAPLL
ncbi:MAG: hypothetical protein ACI802_002532 [Candidatus Paceibacteria bacterium]|jgi:hypothetical protein